MGDEIEFMYQLNELERLAAAHKSLDGTDIGLIDIDQREVTRVFPDELAQAKVVLKSTTATMEILIEDLETLYIARQDSLKAGTDTKALDNLISRSMTSLKDSQAKQVSTKIPLPDLARVVKLSIAFAGDGLGAAQLQDIILLAAQDPAFQYGSERLRHACVRLTRLRSQIKERKDTTDIVGDLDVSIIDLIHEMIYRDERNLPGKIPIDEIPAHHWHIPIQRAESADKSVYGRGLTLVLYSPNNFLIICKYGEDLSKKDFRWKLKLDAEYKNFPAQNLCFDSWSPAVAETSVVITMYSEEARRHLLDKIWNIDPKLVAPWGGGKANPSLDTLSSEDNPLKSVVPSKRAAPQGPIVTPSTKNPKIKCDPSSKK